MKKILIPTDFSENAGDALSYALDFIANQKATIHIVNIINPNFLPVEAPEMSVNLLGQVIDDAKERMKALEAFSVKRFGNDDKAKIKITTDVITGTVAQSIKNEAIEKNVDLIIMGTKGKNHNLPNKIFGTVSTSTITDAPCPIILIPQGYKFKPIDTLVYASNLEPGDPYELWRATELLKPHVGVAKVLYVNTKGNKEENIQRFASYIEAHTSAIQTIFHTEKSEEIEKTIMEYSENHGAELIIMHRLHNSFWSKIFNKSHTKLMVFETNIPLMIINHNEK
jgi:nucleotide-binding universal stress UspA family protein